MGELDIICDVLIHNAPLQLAVPAGQPPADVLDGVFVDGRRLGVL
jgi:hypothetical protein